MDRMGKNCALALLRAYKWTISPLLPPSCRYVPTCSEYAAEAIELHGVMKGSALGAWRLLRCHPFARGGYDPVPLQRLDRAKVRASSAEEIFCGALLRRTDDHPIRQKSFRMGTPDDGVRPHTSTCTHAH